MSGTQTYRLLRAKPFNSVAKFVNGLPVLSKQQIQHFHEHGYLVIEKFLKPGLVDTLHSRFEPLFRGQFDTGVYPDEWHGRTGMALPKLTREICNAWKSDLTIASVALSSQIHALCAQLGGWKGSRIAQDDILWKPENGGSSLGFHQDSQYISSQFTPEPNNSITVWLPLDDVNEINGSIEYVDKSHLWQSPSTVDNTNLGNSDFHSADKHDENAKDQHRMQAIAKLCAHRGNTNNNNQPLDFVCVEIPKGGVSFHHQNIWHGSGLNLSTSIQRRALAIHTLNSLCEFRLDAPITYIYGRYQQNNNPSVLDEKFFPICFGENHTRSQWLTTYCQNAPILREDL